MPVLTKNDTVQLIGFVLASVVEMITYEDDPNGEGTMWGTSGWLAFSAVKALGCRVKVMKSRDGLLGYIDENGTLSGQYLDLYEGVADIGVGPTALNEILDKLIPTGVTYDAGGYYGLISGLKHQYISNPLPYDDAAATTLAIAFLVSIITSLVAFGINSWDRNQSQQRAPKFQDILSLFVQSFFLEATHLIVTNIKLRMIYGTWLFTMLVFSNYLTSEFRSSSMIRFPAKKINTVDEVLQNDKTRLLTPTDMYNFLSNKTWQQRIDRDNGKTGFDVLDDMNVVNSILDGKVAIISPMPSFIQHIRENFCPNPQLGGYFHRGFRLPAELLYVFRFRPGFNQTIAKEFNKRVRWLSETNAPWYENPSFDVRRMRCFTKEETSRKLLSVSESFGFANFKPILLLYLILLGMATVVLIGENTVFLSTHSCHW